jgi:TonB-like protein
VLLRGRKGAKWDPHTAILLVDPEGRNPWYIDVRPPEARQLIQALFEQAGRSRRRADSVEVDERLRPLDRGTCVQAMPGNPWPSYPNVLLRDRRSGEVWTSFVVQTDSTPDMETFRVLLSDAPEFSEAVRKAVRASRYRPGKAGDTIVPMRVYQRFGFRIR